MPLTRANIDLLINRRCGELLRACGFALDEGSSDNIDLNDPVAWALRSIGGSVASIIAPTEAEVAAIADDRSYELLDYIELRALESAYTRYVGVDATAHSEGERHDQLATRIEKAIARKRAQIERDYDTSATTTLTGGVIGLSFQETADAS